MNYAILSSIMILFSQNVFAGDSPCLSKYKIISDQFYIYNEKSAVSNAIMDRIGTYANESDIRTIHPEDAKAWRIAIENFIAVAQPILQNLLEYKAFGCSPDQQTQMDGQINKLTDDLKFSRARLNALISGMP